MARPALRIKVTTDGNLSELKTRAVRRGEGEMSPRFRLYRAENIGRAAALAQRAARLAPAAHRRLTTSAVPSDPYTAYWECDSDACAENSGAENAQAVGVGYPQPRGE
jgi:hypothetical protein